MVDTAKTIQGEDLYVEDYSSGEEESEIKQASQTVHGDYNFVCDLKPKEEPDEDEEDMRLDEEHENLLKKALLYYTQMLGTVKNVNGYDVYLKTEHCEFGLHKLIKLLREQSRTIPTVSRTLFEMQALQFNLVPLLMFHRQDKKLSYMSVMLLYLMTQMPHAECIVSERTIFVRHLQDVKETFIRSEVISVLMEHLADCLQNEQRNEKHEHMIELVVLILKNVLLIPEESTQYQGTHGNLQKRLLLKFYAESVFDSFVFMCQDFSQELFKKLAFEFLEVEYLIFKGFTPDQVFNYEDHMSRAFLEIEAREKQQEKHREFVRTMRHSKFGTLFGRRRADGSMAMVRNLHAPQDMEAARQKQKPKRNTNNNNRRIQAPNQLVDEAVVDEKDQKLLEAVKEHLIDALENSYYPLVEQILSSFSTDSYYPKPQSKCQYFKLSAFMIQVCRLKARKDLIATRQTNPKAPFAINISTIGASLQLQNFELIYATLWAETCRNKVSQQNMKEFHAALQLLIQFLYIIRDMASSEGDEKNKKNAQILQSNVFYHDIMRVSATAFKLYQEWFQHHSYMMDAMEFTHIYLQMLEEYSKGRLLTIQTQKKRKIKKQKKLPKSQFYGEKDEEQIIDEKAIERERRQMEEGDYDEDYDPNNPDKKQEIYNFIDQEYGDEDLDDISDESDSEEKYVERTFNFAQEIALLVDYNIISKYIFMLNPDFYDKKPKILKYTSDFFKRILNQVKQPWIFYQLDYMTVFESLLAAQQQQVNPGLEPPPVLKTPLAREKSLFMSELTNVVQNIVKSFMHMMYKNRLLAVECLFRFPSKEVKDQILTCYEGIAGHTQGEVHIKINSKGQKVVLENLQDELDEEDEEEQERAEEKKRKQNLWSEELDTVLIENYQQFESLDKKARFELLAQLVDGKTARQCYDRVKALRLKKKGAEYAKEMSKKLNSMNDDNVRDLKLSKSIRKFIGQKLNGEMSMSESELLPYIDFIRRIENDFTQFKKRQEEMYLFGHMDVMSEMQRAQVSFTIVPLTKSDFDFMQDKLFFDILSQLLVRKPGHGKQFAFIEGNTKLEEFQGSMNSFWTMVDFLKTQESEYGGYAFTQQKLEELETEEAAMSKVGETKENKKHKKHKDKKSKKKKKNKERKEEAGMEVDS